MSHLLFSNGKKLVKKALREKSVMHIVILLIVSKLEWNAAVSPLLNINSQGSFKRHCKINPIQSFGVKECFLNVKKIGGPKIFLVKKSFLGQFSKKKFWFFGGQKKIFFCKKGIWGQFKKKILIFWGSKIFFFFYLFLGTILKKY